MNEIKAYKNWEDPINNLICTVKKSGQKICNKFEENFGGIEFYNFQIKAQ